MNWTIWHNPRCRKSRETLQLLKDNGIIPKIKLYLKDAPSAKDIEAVITGLDCAPRDLMRRKEDDYKSQNLADIGLSKDALIEAMVNTPKLIERPVVIGPGGVALGRPPEAVLALIKKA